MTQTELARQLAARKRLKRLVQSSFWDFMAYSMVSGFCIFASRVMLDVTMKSGNPVTPYVCLVSYWFWIMVGAIFLFCAAINFFIGFTRTGWIVYNNMVARDYIREYEEFHGEES